jgi:hypothetical protein
MFHCHDIHQRDDGMFDVVTGDTAAGPFPTIAFALAVAAGEEPEPVRTGAGKFRRFRIVRQVLHDAA